jgi:hypothetical protein
MEPFLEFSHFTDFVFMALIATQTQLCRFKFRCSRCFNKTCSFYNSAAKSGSTRNSQAGAEMGNDHVSYLSRTLENETRQKAFIHFLGPFETRGSALALDEDPQRHILTSLHANALQSTVMIGQDVHKHHTFRYELATTRVR